MLNNYKKEYEAIVVPVHLKAETIIKMEEEKRERKVSFITKLITVSFTICLLVIGTLFFTKEDRNTTFVKGEILEEVYINNQKVIFDNAENDLKLAGAGVLKKRVVAKDEALQLWDGRVPVLDLKEYNDLSITYYAYYKDITPIYVEIMNTFTIDDKQFQIIISNNDKKVESNSIISNQKVYVSYQKEQENTKYTMAYSLNERNYSIISDTLEQEEFIYYSVSILNKIK